MTMESSILTCIAPCTCNSPDRLPAQ